MSDRRPRSEPDESILTGVWEVRGRNPAVGAFVLLLALGGVYFAVQIVAQAVLLGIDAALAGVSSSSRLGDLYRPALLAIVVATQFTLLLGAAAAIIRRWHTRRLARYLRLRSFAPGGMLLAAIGSLAIVAPAQFVAEYLYDLVPSIRDLSQASAFLVQADSPGELAAVLGALALTPAICEEFFFRAYFQRTFERRVRAPWSFLVPGFVFALFHQQVLGLPSLVLVGVYLSYLYFAFGSPWPGVVAHLLYNAVQILAANGIAALPGLEPDTGFAAGVAVGGLIVVAFVVAASEYLRRSREDAAGARPA